ncbi:MAG: T9SS type A sorting domain-containing protein [Fibrobacter sp.]|uniref:T9SS type A sorting domain-containing protein n=1 Tax=Fibrobacter sp. TaxID=35828 RepID=UPI0025C5B0BD|nr:T9SS type A sorting domain-containing protein [Fibrobacter sp.]MBR4785114.1 T9SS type A sorting domain-containing protein [Fibrobacter sp.]
MKHKLIYPAIVIGLAATVGMAKEVLLGDFNTVVPAGNGFGYYLHTWDNVAGTIANENESSFLQAVTADSVIKVDHVVKVDSVVSADSIAKVDSIVQVDSVITVTKYVSIDTSNAVEGTDYGIGFFGRTKDIGVTVLYPVGVIGACSEFTYEYRGAAHQFVLVSDGDGNDNMHYTDKNKLIPASDTITVAHVKPSDLKDRYGWGSNHLDASTVVRVRWNLETKFTGEYLYIDNLKCIRPDGYVIAFFNDDLLVKTTILSEGEMVTYPGATPVRAPSDSFTYYFKGWDRPFAAATADTSYYAVFDSSLIYTMEEGETVLIEDFEDCKNGEECVNEWNGKFSLDGVVGNGGKLNVSYVPSAEDSSNAAKLTYLLKQDSAEPPYARAVMSVNDVSARNLSTCEVIKYDYRGAAHNFRVRSSYDVGGNYHMKSVAESEVWKTEVIPVATQLKQQSGWGKAVSLSDAMKHVEAFDWDIQGEIGNEGSLEIDNVSCVNLPVYTITFIDGENVIEELLVSEGDMPKCHLCDSYAKKIEPTVSHRYTFTGMYTPEIVAATADASYQVVWDSTLRTYTVTFLDGIDTLAKAEWVYGSVPAYEGTPAKAATDKFSYVFKAWDKEFAEVTEPATYTALFDSTLNKYFVKFVVDGKADSAQYAYGTKADSLKVPETKKAATDKYTYTFKAWDKKLTDVTGAVTYTALFDSTVNKYLVKFVSDGKTLDSAYYEYGTKADKIKVPEATKKSTKDSSFTFEGWDLKVADVTKNATYTAKFKAKKTDAIVATVRNGIKFGFANNELTVVQPNASMVRVQVFDMIGHLVESFDEQVVGAKNFSLASLPQGTYMVRIASMRQMLTAKVIVK